MEKEPTFYDDKQRGDYYKKLYDLEIQKKKDKSAYYREKSREKRLAEGSTSYTRGAYKSKYQSVNE